MNKPVMQEREPEPRELEAPTLELHTTEVAAHLGNEAGGAVTVLPKRELPASAPVSETAAILQVIERAALNPDVDIDKMERLLQMQERVMGRNAKAAYVAALAEMQPNLPTIQERGGIKDRAGNIQSTYAKWDDINRAIKPVLATNGFALSFRTGQDETRIIVTGVLSHRDGHSEETTMHLPVDKSGSKNDVQAVGSSTSYGKRYTAMALLNLTSSHSEDDDGQAGGGKPVNPDLITPEQVETLQRRLVSLGVDIPKFYQNFAIERLEDLGVPQFGRAMQLLDQRERAAQAKDPTGTLRKQLQDSAAQSGGRAR